MARVGERDLAQAGAHVHRPAVGDVQAEGEAFDERLAEAVGLIEPVGRDEDSAPMLLGVRADESTSEKAAATCDAVLAKEYGPRDTQQAEQPDLYRQRLAWSYTLARRRGHQQHDEDVLAVDLLLAVGKP